MGLLLEAKDVGGFDFEIPEVFLKVITKMLPEVKTVKITSVSTYNMMSAFTFEAIEHFMVRLSVVVEKGAHLRGGRPAYSDEIKNLFRMTYPDYDFVAFEVTELHANPDLSNMEKFVELFKPVK